VSGERQDSNQYLQAIGVVLCFLPALAEAKAALAGEMMAEGVETRVISGRLRRAAGVFEGLESGSELRVLERETYALPWELRTAGRGELGPARGMEMRRPGIEPKGIEEERGFYGMTEAQRDKYVPSVKFGKFTKLGWAGAIEYSDLAALFYSRPNHAGGR